MTSSLPVARPQRKYLSTYYLFNKSHSLPGTLVILKTAFLINERENLISGWKDGWIDADHLRLILFLTVKLRYDG